MNLETDLEKVIWHELGHLYVDLIQCEEFDNYSVDFMYVTYEQKAFGDIKWSGGVRIIPSTEFDQIVKDFKLTSYAVLSLISGCVFETIFRKIIGDSKAVFEDCFGMKTSCPGRHDSLIFFELNSQFKKLYGNYIDYVNFIERELNVLYFEILHDDGNFIRDTKKIAEKIKSKVLESYKASDNKINFSYQFQSEELIDIKEEVIGLLKEATYGRNIRKILSMIFEKIKK